MDTYSLKIELSKNFWKLSVCKNIPAVGIYKINKPYTVTINGKQVKSGNASIDFRNFCYSWVGEVTIAEGRYEEKPGKNVGYATFDDFKATGTYISSLKEVSKPKEEKIIIDKKGDIENANE